MYYNYDSDDEMKDYIDEEYLKKNKDLLLNYRYFDLENLSDREFKLMLLKVLMEIRRDIDTIKTIMPV